MAAYDPPPPLEEIQLGFLEKTISKKQKFNCCKVGGKPVWLALSNLPDPSELLCRKCNHPYVFLLQVYAYLEDIDDAYHRSIYIFMCSNGKCIQRFSNENFVVYRCQLPRKNPFIKDESTLNSSFVEQHQTHTTICDICGCRSTMSCEICSRVNYCSDLHKKEDWIHQEECGIDYEEKNQKKKSKSKKTKPPNRFLLPEYGIKAKREILPFKKPERSEEERMQVYQQLMKSEKAPKELQEEPLEDLDIKNDKVFNKFHKRIKLYSNQILRYQRRGNPLLVSSEWVPSEANIPLCQCGSKRVFEFQVMPTILWDLGFRSEESPDWGTLLVYTCSKSCAAGTSAYAKEFLWKQDYSY